MDGARLRGSPNLRRILPTILSTPCTTNSPHVIRVGEATCARPRTQAANVLRGYVRDKRHTRARLASADVQRWQKAPPALCSPPLALHLLGGGRGGRASCGTGSSAQLQRAHGQTRPPARNGHADPHRHPTSSDCRRRRATSLRPPGAPGGGLAARPDT
jgi:hypothetical protein